MIHTIGKQSINRDLHTTLYLDALVQYYQESRHTNIQYRHKHNDNIEHIQLL